MGDSRTNRELQSEKQRLGQAGESLAAEHLQSLGYRVVERNWRGGRAGEIDIIAVDRGGTLVFVEVKCRRARGVPGQTPSRSDWEAFHMGIAAVDVRKQKKLSAAARLYLIERRAFHKALRFDVVAVALDPRRPAASANRQAIVHVKDAFPLV